MQYIIMLLLLLIPLGAIALYVLQALGLIAIAKKQNVDGGWMAFIPILNLGLMAKIAYDNKYIQWGLPLAFFLTMNFTYEVNGVKNYYGPIIAGGLGSLIGLVAAILTLICLYKIYQTLSDKAVLMLVFSILSFGLLIPIFLFMIRNNELKY